MFGCKQEWISVPGPLLPGCKDQRKVCQTVPLCGTVENLSKNQIKRVQGGAVSEWELESNNVQCVPAPVLQLSHAQGSQNPVLVAGYKSGVYLFASQELCWLAKTIPSTFSCLSYLILDEFQHLFIACRSFLPAAGLVFQILKCVLCCSG